MLSWFRPGLNGAFNTARRALSTGQLLESPLPVFGTSVLAASAGAVSNFTIGMGKAIPWISQVRSENLIGGTQTLNLFKLTKPQADKPLLSWGDAAAFTNYAKDVMWEMKERLRHSINPQRSWRDFSFQAQDVLRNVALSAIGSMLSAGAGSKLAELARRGDPTPFSGESFRSRPRLLQQFAESTTYDYVWEAFTKFTKSDAYNLSQSLDRAHDQKQLSLLLQAKQASRELSLLLYKWRKLMPVPIQRIEQIGEANHLLNKDLNVREIIAIREVLKSDAVSTCQRTAIQLHFYAKLLAATEKVIGLIRQRDALVARRSPAASRVASPGLV